MSSKLFEITDYSAEEIARAEKFSSAITLYLKLIHEPATTPAQKLRQQRHHAWLKCALASFHKKHSPAEICSYWSASADEICLSAWEYSGCDQEPLALFALGKWGSSELNLSSDIDIVFISKLAPTTQNLKCVRLFISLLSDQTSSGFCYRVDTDLKPGGRLSPLICSIKQFEDYYWSSGETWERLALVRMRAICGDKENIGAINEITEKFVFRRFIDFTLLEDLKRLRSQIHAHYPQLDEHKINLKLAPGGIRDIELFIHALQVIHGGKESSLRTTSTTDAAKALIHAKRFNQNDLEFLITTYWQFRDLENTVQIIGDNQTHDWVESYGKDELQEFKSLALRVSEVVEPVLGRPSTISSLPKNHDERTTWLKSLNYSDASIEQHIPALLSLTAISTRTFQDEELRLKVLRRFLETLSSVAIDMDLGVALLTDFFKATRAKTAFFSLLAHEDRLIRELCVLFGCSPYLGGILAARPELLDSYLYRAQAKASANLEQFLDQLTERRLLNEIISAIQFLQTQNVSDLCATLSRSADEICTDLLTSLKNEYGASDLQILALGKWGGSELGYRSDLDFIFITELTPSDLDQKIAKRFIARLTDQHKGGSIFEVDMRLRPSGKGGPLLVSHDMLLKYLTEKADVWERQSYLRSRVVGEDSPLIKKILIAITSKSVSSADLNSLIEIRNQLLKNSTDQIEIKYSPGGLVDIEFAAQISILQEQLTTPPDTIGMLAQLSASNSLYKRNQKELTKNYLFLRLVEQFFQLLNQHPVSSLRADDPGFARVATILNAAPQDLFDQLQDVLNKNVEILLNVDRRQGQK